jgi:hypothetical protein
VGGELLLRAGFLGALLERVWVLAVWRGGWLMGNGFCHPSE